MIKPRYRAVDEIPTAPLPLPLVATSPRRPLVTRARVLGVLYLVLMVAMLAAWAVPVGGSLGWWGP